MWLEAPNWKHNEAKRMGIVEDLKWIESEEKIRAECYYCQLNDKLN